MTVVDASVWVAYFHDQDRFHQQSVAWLQQYLLAGGVLASPRFVLPEVAGALTRRTGDPAVGHDAVLQLHSLSALSLMPVTDQIIDAAATLAADLRLKGADAVYIALAADLGYPLVTWDDEQLNRGGARVVVRRPV